MMRALASTAVMAVMTMPVMTSSGAPHHRAHRPPPALARSLTVDEQEWSVIPSKKVVAAGVVTFRVYNRGQDMHNLVVKGPGGVRGMVSLLPGTSGTILAHLRRGTYRLFCSMFGGTPQSHEMRGMQALLRVR